VSSSIFLFTWRVEFSDRLRLLEHSARKYLRNSVNNQRISSPRAQPTREKDDTHRLIRQNQGLVDTDTITYSEPSAVSSQLGSFPSGILSTLRRDHFSLWQLDSLQHIDRASCNSGEESRLDCVLVPHELPWKRSDLISSHGIAEIYDTELSFVSWLCVSIIRFVVHHVS